MYTYYIIVYGMLIGHQGLCSHMTIIYTINTVHEIAHPTMEKKQKVQDRKNVVFFIFLNR